MYGGPELNSQERSSNGSSDIASQIVSSTISSMTNNLVPSDNNNNINASQIMFQYKKNNLIGKGTFGKVYTALD